MNDYVGVTDTRGQKNKLHLRDPNMSHKTLCSKHCLGWLVLGVYDLEYYKSIDTACPDCLAEMEERDITNS